MNIFISSNNTSQGKTYSTLKLIEHFSKKGYKVAAFKPVETGVGDIPQDGLKLYEAIRKFNKFSEKITLEDIVPVRLKLPAAPIVAGKCDFSKIEKSYKKLKKISDILLIEGAGGLLVPVQENFYMKDFINFFDAKLFMVFGSRLGMINDFLLNTYYLKSKNVDFVWGINIFDEQEYFEISHPFMKKFKPMFIQKDIDKITQKLLKD